MALIGRHRNTYERQPALPPAQRHMDASHAGERVQLDCFYLGRLSGTIADRRSEQAEQPLFRAVPQKATRTYARLRAHLGAKSYQ
jgi:hypothetical protein